MFLLGQWRNYDDLEEALTLNELMITYNRILENKNEHMEFSAKLAGAEIKSSNQSSQNLNEKKESNIVSNLRKAKESQLQSDAKNNKSASFSDGVGYQVI